MIKDLYDFRGGYSSNLPPELMPENMLSEGTNLYWKGKLQGRPGWTNLSTDATINGGTVRGFCRAYINDSWVNVVALDDGSNVNFYYGDTGSYTAIDNTYDWTTGTQVEMRYMASQRVVIAVNGADKPAIIYYDSAWTIENLETYDAIERGDDEWYAGLWDNSEAIPFVDDTEHAQDTVVDNFQIAVGGSNNDGFYVSGVTVFNKVEIKNCPAFDGSPVAEYAYYAGDNTWTTFTPTTAPSWAATEGDKTLEFDLPFDTDGTLLWKTYGDLSDQQDPAGAAGGALNRYIIRVRFTTAPTSNQSADRLELSMTQYLSLILLNDKPHLVEIHKDRVFLATGNAFRFSPPNQVKGWSSRDIEYCDEGGRKIIAMVSADDYLAVFKEAAVYRYYGTTTRNFVLRKSNSEGAVSARGAALIGSAVAYVAEDGIRALVGENSVLVSRHIQSDFDSWTHANAAIVNWDGNALISFPSNDVMLWVDPDTLREDTSDAGEGRVSFWKWSGPAVTCWAYANGAGDNGYIIGFDLDGKRFIRNTTNGYDVAFDATETAITNTFQTKYESYGAPGVRKVHKRVKVETNESGDWTFTAQANNGDNSASKTISTGTGTGHHIEMVALPYSVDGYNFSVKMVNATTNAVEIYGITVEAAGRTF